ncbi:MAG: hypothetical protein GX647_01465 [Clostridiales bacterium]|jgi:hypothetical protein|nr:hypothetical protein [Clostridiales bacterium]
MGARRVLAALTAFALLLGGAIAEGKWSVAPPKEEAAFDGAHYTAKGRLSAEVEVAPGGHEPSAAVGYEFELSVREAADGWNAELVLDQLLTFTGKEPALSSRIEASLSIGTAGGSGLLKYTSFDSLGNPKFERRYSAALDEDFRLTVRDESTGEVILDSGSGAMIGPSAAANLAAWAGAHPELEQSVRKAFGPLVNKLEGFLFGNVDSAVVHMRELALPIAQFFGDPQVDRALEALGMPELPIPHISLLELLDAANGVFEFSRLENGDVSVVYCSQGSPMTSAFKVEAVIHRAGLDFKVLRTDYGGAYDTVGAGEIDLSDGLHFAIEDYGFGAFLYLDASAGEMSDTRQAFDARAAYKLETYDDPTLLLLHFENAIDAPAGTARTDATLRAVEAESTTTIALEIDHTFKE